MEDKTIIISGADSYRYNAHLNHQKFADIRGINYKFHLSSGLANPFFTKCYAILDSFEQGYEYVLWIDDDAFFINLNWNCLSVFQEHAEDVIVTQGRTNKKSGTTLFNNGIMFIKNTPIMKELFTDIPVINWNEMKSNWNYEWGPCEGNDQPRMIYITQTRYPEAVRILDYPGFNAHEITFKQRKNFLETNPPIVHITGQKKENKIKRFTQVTGISLP